MRLNKEKQTKLEPQRLEYAKSNIMEKGYEIYYESDKELRFMFKGHVVYLFAYSGWFTGVTVTDGRGINKLLKQI